MYVASRGMKADLNPGGCRRCAPVRTHRVLEGIGVEFGDRRERLFLERRATHALDGKRSQLPVRRHERPQVEAALCMHQPMRVNDVVLLPPARHRVVAHADHALMEDGFEQAGDHVVGGHVVPLRASRVGGDRHPAVDRGTSSSEARAPPRTCRARSGRRPAGTFRRSTRSARG